MLELSQDEYISFKRLIYFYLKTNMFDSAYRGAKVLSKIYKDDIWSLGVQIICADSMGNFDEVIDKTHDLSRFEQDKKMYKALLFLKIRAYFKKGRESEAKELLTSLELM